MNTRTVFVFLVLFAACLSGHAFDLGDLTRAVAPGDDRITKGLDTAKDLGKVAKGIAGIGPEEEKAIGDSVALEIVGKYGGLVRGDALMQRVNLGGRSLAAPPPRPPLPRR